MRAVVQRAVSGSVSVEGEVVGVLPSPGLVVLLGVTHDDGPDQVARMARKLTELRILPGPDGDRSAREVGAPLLIVSQFTLYGDVRKGRRPSWSDTAPAPVAEPLVDAVVAAVRARGLEVATGVFGAMMQVELVNDGPFTIWLEV